MGAHNIYGGETRVGIMIPSCNTIAEPEMNAMKPAGFSVHTARIYLTDGTTVGLERMSQDTERAAELLGTAGVDIIAYTCTTGSLVGGLG